MRKFYIIFAAGLIAIFSVTTVFADGWQFWKKSKKTPTAAEAQAALKKADLNRDIPTSARTKMADLEKYDPKEEMSLLRSINKELESYLPQIKQLNDDLKARISEVEKENAALKDELVVLRHDKGPAVSKKELDRLERENARLRQESLDLKKQNKILSDEKTKLTARESNITKALKDQHLLVTDEVGQMRKDNEALLFRVAELKKSNEELDIRAAKLEDINNMLRQELGRK